MLRNVLLSSSSNLTAAVNLLISSRRSYSPFQRFFSDSPPQSRVSELTRVDSLVDGCDYNHWLVVMQPPDNFPQREEIIQQYVATLAMALGSEKAAKESIYSVSTKYYYAFSCKVDENMTHKIKCLPRVKWILPDSFLCDEEGGYGGEPYVDGKVVPYEEKYHADWLHDAYDGDGMGRTRSRKPRRRRSSSTNATSDSRKIIFLLAALEGITKHRRYLACLAISSGRSHLLPVAINTQTGCLVRPTDKLSASLITCIYSKGTKHTSFDIHTEKDPAHFELHYRPILLGKVVERTVGERADEVQIFDNGPWVRAMRLVRFFAENFG